MYPHPESKWSTLTRQIKTWGLALGFQQVGISHINLDKHKIPLQRWLDNKFHGDMQFMQENLDKRCNPALLVPDTMRVVSVRMDYLPPDAQFAKNLKNTNRAYISRYATGRDYHKVLRNRLKKLGEQIQEVEPEARFRPFVDSAPVLEHAIAQNAGIGWTGKHSLTLNEEAGSWFFLGELFVNLPLTEDQPAEDKCGNCVACLKICPTNAIVAPYEVDARRCISYLTIENRGDIPEEFRKAIGNRIYGCDDCQLICPWNRYSNITQEVDFDVRNNLTTVTLLALFDWEKTVFLERMQGSPIRRIGYDCWVRNISIALGNANYSSEIVTALHTKRQNVSEMVQRHIDWALLQQEKKRYNTEVLAENRLQVRLVNSVEKGLPRDA